jgi:iron complex outermembrane recepter protein
MNVKIGTHAGLLACSALTIVALAATPALAQDSDAEDNGGLTEIIVTAQKREQSVQDVPIAVSALGGEALQANRVVTVSDLGGLAPGVTVRTAAGGSQLPSFSVRGAVSYGVVPGSDRQVSMYLDGVYISSPRGSIFDLPDLERIEILRGPQGTLFGRNATAGAISITTREPTGEAGVKATASIGNRDLTRYGLSADLPRMGPFSAYFSYVHEERHGDIRNLDSGITWDRTSSLIPQNKDIRKSVDWLGSKNSDSYFAAVKFESGDFKTVYKFDRTDATGSAEGTVPVVFAPNAIIIPGAAPFFTALYGSNNLEVVNSVRRPKTARNGWVVPYTQQVQGHSLTSTYEVSDNLSIKNILAFRKSFIFNTSALDGFAGLPLTAAAAPLFGYPASFVGRPFVGLGIQITSRNEQISDELQINYDSDFLTATAGALWFEGKDWTNESRQQNTVFFFVPTNGAIPNANNGFTYNKAVSLAAYAQLEFHVTPQLDVILGGRITRDKKTGFLETGYNTASTLNLDFTYKKTKPSYLFGVNYKPNDDILVYAKYSTAFVSGGSVGGVPFDAETAKSWEGGVKADLLDNRLRTSLSLYHASYKNYQAAQAANNFAAYITEVTGDPTRAAALGTFVVTSGGVKAKGFEFDFSAAPAEGFTLGGSLGYSKVTYSNVNPVILAQNGGQYQPESLRPAWTGSLWGQYQTQPLIGDAYLTFRADGIWQSKMQFAQNPNQPAYVANPNYTANPAYWILNSRIALRDLDLGGVKSELAVWGRNLTDAGFGMFPGDYTAFTGIGVMNFIPARSYGLDLTVRF